MNDVPVIDLILKSVEAMASEQGIKPSKLQRNKKFPLHPVDWISGLDYDDEYNE